MDRFAGVDVVKKQIFILMEKLQAELFFLKMVAKNTRNNDAWRL